MNTSTRALTALRRYIDYARWLSRTRYSSRTGWTLPYKGSTVYLENLCDFLTTRDLMVGQHYKLLEDHCRPGSVVIDIGMNIGAVSLMFAKLPMIAHVYGYEPMKHTYDCAIRSIGMNPEIADKITPINIGVGGADREIQVQYTAKTKCAIGMYDIDPFLKMVCGVRELDMSTEPLTMKEASSVVREIRQIYPSADILMKLDAEGAEYEIVDQLAETDMLKEITCAVIEWHGFPGPDRMLKQLIDVGFNTSDHILEPKIGLVNAWRT